MNIMVSDSNGTISATNTTIELGNSTTITSTSGMATTGTKKYYVYEDDPTSTPLTSGTGNSVEYIYTPSTTGVHTIYIKYTTIGKAGEQTIGTLDITITVCSPPLVNSTVNVNEGQAILQVLETLQPGTYTIHGTYHENTHYQSGTDTGTMILIQKKNVTCTLSSTTNEIYIGNSTNLTVQVKETSTNNPVTTGTVTLYIDGTPTIFNQTLNSNGTCTLQITPNSLGTHTYYITYNGTNEYNTNQSETLQINTTNPTTTGLPYNLQNNQSELLITYENENNATTHDIVLNGIYSTAVQTYDVDIHLEGTQNETNTQLSNIDLGVYIYNKTLGELIHIGKNNHTTSYGIQLPTGVKNICTYSGIIGDILFDTTTNSYVLDLTIENLTANNALSMWNNDPTGEVSDEIFIATCQGPFVGEYYTNIYYNTIIPTISTFPFTFMQNTPPNFEHTPDSQVLLWEIYINEDDLEYAGDLSETDGNGGWTGDYLNDNYNGLLVIADYDWSYTIIIGDEDDSLTNTVFGELNPYYQGVPSEFHGGDGGVEDGEVLLGYDISDGLFSLVLDLSRSNVTWNDGGYLLILNTSEDENGPRTVWNSTFTDITGVDPSNYINEE